MKHAFQYIFLQELEDEKEQNRKMYREKLANLNQAKESVALEKERELDAMKEKLEQVGHEYSLFSRAGVICVFIMLI